MSYAATTSITNTVSDDATFRTWGSAWAAKFASMGLVQTGDANQINWVTVNKPAAINTVAGYELWGFNDAMQAASPIYVKVEYGTGAVATSGSLWITLGSGTNAAGLTGAVSTRQQVQCTATAGAINHYWSGDTNRLGVAVMGASAATSMGIWIERTVDATGAVTNEGALMIYRGTSAWGQVAWNRVTGPYTATWEASIGAMGPAVAPFGTTGLQLAMYPIYHNKGVFLNPGLNGFVFEKTVVTALTTITFTVYGASHTYLTLDQPQFGSANRGGFSSAANACLAMRYE